MNSDILRPVKGSLCVQQYDKVATMRMRHLGRKGVRERQSTCWRHVTSLGPAPTHRIPSLGLQSSQILLRVSVASESIRISAGAKTHACRSRRVKEDEDHSVEEEFMRL